MVPSPPLNQNSSVHHLARCSLNKSTRTSWSISVLFTLCIAMGNGMDKVGSRVTRLFDRVFPTEL